MKKLKKKEKPESEKKISAKKDDFDDLSEKLASTADMADYNGVETRKLKRKLGLI